MNALTLKKKAKPAPLPQHPGLAIPLHCKLSKDNAKAVAQYHKDCIGFDSRKAELEDRHHALHEQGGDLTIKAVAEIGDELCSLMADLKTELCSLRWRRFEIMPTLKGDFEAGLKAAVLWRESKISTVEKYLAGQGITAQCYPQQAAAVSVKERWLRERIQNEDSVVCTIQQIQTSKSAMPSVCTFAAPRAPQFALSWPQASGKYSAAISAAAQLSRQQPGPLHSPGFEKVARELGLGDRPLTPAITEQIEAICEMPCIASWQFASPVREALSSGNPDVLVDLVGKLPVTTEIRDIGHIANHSGKF